MKAACGHVRCIIHGAGGCRDATQTRRSFQATVIPEVYNSNAMAAQVCQSCIVLWCAWLVTLGPAICLLRGRNAADLMFKVTLYTYAIAVGTRLCNLWYFLQIREGVPLGYLLRHGYDGLLVRPDRPVVLIIWFCGGIAVHSLIYSVSMLRGFWTAARNRAAVVFYAGALVVGLLHPLPVVYFWSHWNGMVDRSTGPTLEANRELTEARTREWVLQNPDDSSTLLMRARFLSATGRHAEALPLYERALMHLPREREPVRAGIEKMIKETNELLRRSR